MSISWRAGATSRCAWARSPNSTYGVTALGVNPWVMVAAPAYLDQRGAPQAVAELADHACIVYSSVQGNDVWRFLGPEGPYESAQLSAPLRSNNLSVVLAAARAGMGLAILPHYVAASALAEGALQVVMRDHPLPSQRIQAVTPSPRLVAAQSVAVRRLLAQAFRRRVVARGRSGRRRVSARSFQFGISIIDRAL